MNGSVRTNRGQPALSPDSAPVDGRDLPQLLCLVAEFARLFSFTELNGSVNGDWQVFFQYDLSFLLAQILCFNTEREQAEVEGIVHGVADPKLRDIRLLERLFMLFKLVSGWALCAREIGLQDKLNNLDRLSNLDTPTSLTLETLIKEKLAPLYQSLRKNTKWSPTLSRLQEKYFSVCKDDERAWLLQLWTLDIDDQSDGSATPYLHAAHLSFVVAINGLMVPIHSYFDDALNNTFGHQPHSALMVAFLNLMRHAQADANAITGRHLDFYYRQVLRLQQRIPKPDLALLSFRPSPTGGAALLPAGTLLKGGKLANGQDLLYAVNSALVVNQDTIAALKTVHATPAAPMWPGGPTGISRLYAAPQADSEDGLGAPLSDPEQGWPTFGRDWDHNPRVTDSAPLAAIGVLLTSPVLLLKGGRRMLRVRLQFKKKAEAGACAGLEDTGAEGKAKDTSAFSNVVNAYYDAVGAAVPDFAGRSHDAMVAYTMSTACEVWLTTQGGWQRAANVVVHGHPLQAWIELLILLPASFPAVVAGPPAPGEAGGAAPWPRLKIMLNPNARVYPYAYLQQLQLQGISLRARVTGLAPALLSSNQKPLRAGQPFFPFGSIPIIGSTLELADPELACKPIVCAAMTIAWFNLPLAPGDLAQRYAGYGQPAIENRSFQAGWQIQRQGRWSAPGGPFPLFTAIDQSDAPLQPTLSLYLRLPNVPPQPWDGVRIQLASPPGAFGHAQYPQLMMASALNAAASMSQDLRSGLASAVGTSPPPRPLPVLPQPPFAPQAQQVTLSYLAFDMLEAVRTPDALSDPQPCFYQLGPFGYRAARLDGTPLLEGLQRHGQLYIGLRQLVPGQIVSLLFGMRETGAQQRAVRNAWPSFSEGELPAVMAVDWHYLIDNEWRRFGSHAVLSDSTNDLTCSGIVRLQTGEGCLNSDNTLLPPGLFWIAAAVDHADLHSHVTLLDTQGASATQVLMGLTPQAGGALPANSIQAFVSKPRGMHSVSQALPTLGGQGAEGATDFQVRVSERLRHKQRAVRARDFEQLVLDQYADVSQAKCITPSLLLTHAYHCAAVPPGSVGLVLVPQPAQNALHAARPSVPVARLLEIREWLLQRSATTFRNLLVFSPQYEEVKVCMTFELQPDCDFIFVRGRLNDAISAWLAPWRTQAGQALAIGGNASSVNDLYVFLIAQAGVALLDKLQVLHVYELAGKRVSRWLKRDDVLMPATPWSVLVPAKRHFITSSKQRYGIGQMAVGADVMIISANALVERHAALRQNMSSSPSGKRHDSVYLPLSKLPNSAI